MNNRDLRRAVAGLLAALILAGAPGFGSYEAAAQVVRAPAAGASSAVSGAAAAVAAVPLQLSSPSFLASPALSISAPLSAPAARAFALPPLPSASAPAAAAHASPAIAPAVAAPAPAPALPTAVRGLAASLPSAGPRAQRGDVSASPSAFSDGRALFDQAAVRPSDDPLAVLAAPQDGPAPENGLKPSEPAAAPAKTKIPKPLWGFFWGHDIATVLGINFHVLSQPFLVQDTLGLGTAMMGLTRNIHMGSMAIVNFLPIGYLIDKTDYRVVSITTAVVRALLMGAIPMLWGAGLLHYTVLAAIIAFNPLFQSTMIVAEGAAFKTILGKDEKLNKDATATFSKWDSVAGTLMPLIAGWVVGALVASFGLGGYAMAYGLYAALLLVSIPIYWFTVKDPRFPEKLGAVAAVKQGAKFLGALIWSMVYPFVALAKWLLNPLKLWRALKGLPAALRAARRSDGPKGLAGLADRLDRYKPMQGLAYILRNKTLRVLTAVMALEVLLSDALPFVILPNLVTEALGKAPAWLPSMFATAGGIMGVLFSVEYLGRFLPSWRLEGDRGDKIIEKAGHGAFYRRAAVASLLFWALLSPLFLTTGMFWVNLAIVGAVMFGVQYFNTPVGIVLAPVKRAQIDDDKVARVESAVFMVDVAFESIGALALGLLMDFAGLKVALIAVAAFLSLTGILQYQVPKWIFPDGNRPEKKPEA